MTYANPRRIQAVLFDLGDTLIYFDDDWPVIFRQAKMELLRSLEEAGFELGKEFLDEFSSRMEAYYRERDTEFIEYTTRYILHKMLENWGQAEVPEEALSRALEDMHAVTQAHWIPEEDALATLERLHLRGYRIGLISNAADDPNTQTLVDKLGGRPYFEVVLSSAAMGIRKPDPRIFWKALEQMGLSPNQAVMVGDTLGADILGAKNAGIFSIWITRRADTPANRAHRDTIHPEAQIKKLSELPSLLAEIENEP
jgi:putative hydrolase of the HAD superfamily